MTQREPLLSEAYFDKHIAFVEQTIAEYENDLHTNPAQFTDLAGVYFVVFQHRLAHLISCYSRGYPVEKLRDTFYLVITAWEKQREVDTSQVYAGHFRDDVSNYIQAMWLVSWASLLRIEKALVSRLLACVKNEGQDLLFEQLVARITPDVARSSAKKLLYPKAYQPLYDALNAPTDQQAGLMRQFLHNWYKRLSNADWHDAHKGPGGGGFDGYWCWEAAGVALAFGIDDTSFREMPYYPKDLADYARAAG